MHGPDTKRVDAREGDGHDLYSRAELDAGDEAPEVRLAEEYSLAWVRERPGQVLDGRAASVGDGDVLREDLPHGAQLFREEGRQRTLEAVGPRSAVPVGESVGRGVEVLADMLEEGVVREGVLRDAET